MTNKKDKIRIGILTSGGDCPGLNATIRGVMKAGYEMMNCEFIGIKYGYKGLIEKDTIELTRRDIAGILHRGGTILRSIRTPYKKMQTIEADGVDKVQAMINNYNALALDCLVTLGGAGTHKNAHLLSQRGLNVVALPKTIDNDLWGTDVTFGYQTAVDTGVEILDRLHTTADSHNRVMVVELMGNKVGWLTLNTGIAGGADVIVIPEIPYDKNTLVEAIRKRHVDKNKDFSIVVVAEGAKSVEETNMSKEAFKKYKKSDDYLPPAENISHMIAESTGIETRVVVPGHILRGGSPSAFDRTLATNIGAYGAELIKKEQYGITVSVKNDALVTTPLEEVAHKRKTVPFDSQLIKTAKSIGISFGGKIPKG